MTMIKNKYLLINILLFLFIFLANYFFPLIADDFHYMNKLVFYHQSIWGQIWGDYQNLTGRISAQILVYILFIKSILPITFTLICIISASCYVLFNSILYKFCVAKIRQNKSIYLFFTIMLIFYFIKIGSFDEVIEQKVMTIQYFWGTVLMIYIINEFEKLFLKDKIYLVIPLFILGILLGCYNEILSLMFIFIIGYRASLNKHVFKNKVFIIFMVGIFIGFVIMLISPGTAERKTLSLVALQSNHIHFTIIQKIVFPFKAYFQVSLKKIVFILTMIMLLINYSKKQFSEIKLDLLLILFFLFSLSVMIPFAFCYQGGWIGGRVTLVADMILFIVFIKQILTFEIINVILNKVNYKFLLILSLLCFTALTYSSYLEFKFNQSRDNLIKLAINAKQRGFVFPSYRCIDKFFNHNSLSRSNLFYAAPGLDWRNNDYAEFYGAGYVIEDTCYPMIPVNVLKLDHKVKAEINSYIDDFTTENGTISISGWAYIRSSNALENKVYLKFTGLNGLYIFDLNKFFHNGVATHFSDGTNLKYSGFHGQTMLSNLKSGIYNVTLIILNKNKYGEYVVNNSYLVK